MGITVAQALKLGGLRQGRLLGGASNLEPVIEEVNVIWRPSIERWRRSAAGLWAGVPLWRNCPLVTKERR
jgi:hypothetical protein